MEKNIIERLIDAKVFTHKDVEEYLNKYNKKQKRLIQQQVAETSKAQDNQVERYTYSKIENGVLKEFDERDVDKTGNYTVPVGVFRIGKYAFSSCNKITSVTLGPNVKIIESEAFFNCGLQYINLENVEIVGEWAFSFCMNLEEITLSRQLKRVGNTAFYNCINLRKFITPKRKAIILAGSEWVLRPDAQNEIQAYIISNKEVAR